MSEMKINNPVTEVLGDLVAAARFNNRLAPEDRDLTLTVCMDQETRDIVMVHGSAHQLGGLFKELFSQRPELRAVVQEALNGMYKVHGEGIMRL